MSQPWEWALGSVLGIFPVKGHSSPGSPQSRPALPSEPEPAATGLRTGSLSAAGGGGTPNLIPLLPTPTRAPQNKRVFLATFAAVLGNFSFGYALVYTSPVIPALEHSLDPDLKLTKAQASWFGVRATLGAGDGQSRVHRAPLSLGCPLGPWSFPSSIQPGCRPGSG